MKKNKVDLSKVEELYSENIEKFGINSKSVGWTTLEGQVLRFQKLLEVIEDKSNSFSVNELGCGYGELFNYLVLNDLKISEYNGYDISDKMLNAARKYITDSRVHFIKNSAVNKISDYSITSGIFNVRFQTTEEQWTEYIISILNNMNEFSKKGFSFNLLTNYVDYKEAHLYYGDPIFFFDYCKKNFSKKVSLLHDYEMWEWTIVVKK